MTKKEQLPDAQRRNFLRGSMAAATGVAVATSAGKSIANISDATVTEKTKAKEGYRLTKHIKDYYKSAAI